MLGRLAFPLYCWCMAVGATRTRSMPRYILRLLLDGLISQPLYNIALNHTWSDLNVFFTLAIGLAGIWGLKEKRFGSHIWGPLAALCLAAWLKPDYGWKGVMLMLLLYAARDSRGGIAGVMLAFSLFWGTSSSTVSSICGFDTRTLLGMDVIGTLLTPWLKLQALSVLALPLMLWQCNVSLRLPKVVGYLLYPGHLVLLFALEKLTGVL